jgi:hypothetical protein
MSTPAHFPFLSVNSRSPLSAPFSLTFASAGWLNLLDLPENGTGGALSVAVLAMSSAFPISARGIEVTRVARSHSTRFPVASCSVS